MCGELEENGTRSEELYARFVAHTRSFLAGLKSRRSDDPLHNHLDELFRRTLTTAASDDLSDTISGYERLAMEPLVFARLAGFMAAHLPLEEDPLKRVVEALMMGYSEGEIELPDHGHHHGHSHGHAH